MCVIKKTVHNVGNTVDTNKTLLAIVILAAALCIGLAMNAPNHASLIVIREHTTK